MDFQSTTGTIDQAFRNTFKGVSDDMQKCIEICLQCHKICEQLIPYCLEKGGKHSERQHIEKLFACGDICRTSAHFMMWNSDLHPKVCDVCAQTCIQCAEDCERMSDDEMMKLCADACRKCADSCREMATQH